MTRLIAGAATALIATMLGTASVGAVDLSGGTLNNLRAGLTVCGAENAGRRGLIFLGRRIRQ